MIFEKAGRVKATSRGFFRIFVVFFDCHSLSKKYTKIAPVGIKTQIKKMLFWHPPLPMQKVGSKWSLNRFYMRGSYKSLPLSMSIPEAPYGRVKVVGSIFLINFF